MKLFVLLTLMFCSLGSVSAQPVEKPKLRILTFNILGGRNVDGSRNLDRVADVINQFKPDLVALQEVDVKTRRCGMVDIPAVLAEKTGMHARFGEAMPYDGGSYGEAILSRHEIIRSKNHLLPHEKGSEPRAAIEVTVNIKNCGEVTFVGTHLDHQRSDKNRMMQVTSISQIYKDFDGHLFLSGDLNAAAESNAMKELLKQFTDAWKNTDQNKGFTYPSTEKANIRIDYILMHSSTAPQWKVSEILVGNQLKQDQAWQKLLSVASDHYPVFAEFELK